MSDFELLILADNTESGPSTKTRFGGKPSVGPGFSWPVCEECDGNMQFQGQVRSHRQECLHLFFMCQNDPGVCGDWEADGGANAVISTPVSELKLADVPQEGVTLRDIQHGARIERMQAESYDEARQIWSAKNGNQQRHVLGHQSAVPVWLQGDETPECDHCNTPMRFVAQLESGPDYSTEMNFGGGCGYLFECTCKNGTGKFLWQS